jgi:hypothetical protein
LWLQACLEYVQSRCDKPTQDTYHVPPEWLVKSTAEGGLLREGTNEMMVWSNAKMPNNITTIDPTGAWVAYRVDPPKIRAHVEELLATVGHEISRING